MSVTTNKKYLLSPVLYTHSKHRHWLQMLNTAGITRKLQRHETKIMAGRRLSSKDAKFNESETYEQLHHQLDLISGEYVNVLKKYARELIKQQLEKKGISYDKEDLKWTTNFTSSAENSIENRMSGDYYKKGRYYFDSDAGQITVSFNDVEAYAYAQKGA